MADMSQYVKISRAIGLNVQTFTHSPHLSGGPRMSVFGAPAPPVGGGMQSGGFQNANAGFAVPQGSQFSSTFGISGGGFQAGSNFGNPAPPAGSNFSNFSYGSNGSLGFNNTAASQSAFASFPAATNGSDSFFQAPGPQPQPQASKSKKSKMCSYFLQGRCTNQPCNYSHDMNGAASADSMMPADMSMGESRPKRTCNYFASGQGCPHGNQCKFSHDVSSSGYAAPQAQMDDVGMFDSKFGNARTQKPCTHFARGKCRNGDSCPFSHDTSFLPAPQATYEPPANTWPAQGNQYSAPQMGANQWGGVGYQAAPAVKAQPSRKPCYHFLNGHCSKGDNCTFLHDTSLLPAPQPQPAVQAYQYGAPNSFVQVPPPNNSAYADDMMTDEPMSYQPFAAASGPAVQKIPKKAQPFIQQTVPQSGLNTSQAVYQAPQNQKKSLPSQQFEPAQPQSPPYQQLQRLQQQQQQQQPKQQPKQSKQQKSQSQPPLPVQQEPQLQYQPQHSKQSLPPQTKYPPPKHPQSLVSGQPQVQAQPSVQPPKVARIPPGRVPFNQLKKQATVAQVQAGPPPQPQQPQQSQPLARKTIKISPKAQKQAFRDGSDVDAEVEAFHSGGAVSNRPQVLLSSLSGSTSAAPVLAKSSPGSRQTPQRSATSYTSRQNPPAKVAGVAAPADPALAALSTVLTAKNLVKNTKKHDLWQHFTQFGQVKAIEIRGRDAHCRFESADQMRLALKMGRDFQNSELNLAPASKAVLQVKQLFTDQVQAPGTAPPSQPASVVVRPATATVQPQPVVPIKLRLVRPNKSQSTPPPLLPVAESEPEPEEDEPEQDEDEPEDAEDNEEEFDDDQDDQDEQDDQDDQNDQEQDYSDEDQSHDSDQDDGDEQQEEAEPIQVLPAMLAAPQSNQKVQDARQKAMEAKKKREEAARLESQPPRVSPSPQPVNDDEEGDHLRDGFVGIGQCMHLTTEIDFKQRTESRNTSVFEHYDCQSWKERDFERSLMLKPNIRSGAGSIALPENIRPPVVLQRAMNHIIDFCMIHEGAAYHPDLFNDFDEQAGLVRLWTFLFDRCRSIRKDFIYQVSASRGCLSVAVHEQQTRFFVYCAHSLYSTLQHDSTQALGFSWKLNDESINRSISSLLIYYSDNRARGRVFESEPEFSSYALLMKMTQSEHFATTLLSLPSDVAKSEPVQLVLQALSAMRSGNVVRFFKVAQQASILQACLLHRYFTGVRSAALKSYCAAYKTVPVDKLTAWLCFDTDQQTVAFCSSHGLKVDDDGDVVLKIDSVSQFGEPIKLPDAPPSYSLIYSRIEAIQAELESVSDGVASTAYLQHLVRDGNEPIELNDAELDDILSRVTQQWRAANPDGQRLPVLVRVSTGSLAHPLSSSTNRTAIVWGNQINSAPAQPPAPAPKTVIPQSKEVELPPRKITISVPPKPAPVVVSTPPATIKSAPPAAPLPVSDPMPAPKGISDGNAGALAAQGSTGSIGKPLSPVAVLPTQPPELQRRETVIFPAPSLPPNPIQFPSPAPLPQVPVPIEISPAEKERRRKGKQKQELKLARLKYAFDRWRTLVYFDFVSAPAQETTNTPLQYRRNLAFAKFVQRFPKLRAASISREVTRRAAEKLTTPRTLGAKFGFRQTPSVSHSVALIPSADHSGGSLSSENMLVAAALSGAERDALLAAWRATCPHALSSTLDLIASLQVATSSNMEFSQDAFFTTLVSAPSVVTHTYQRLRQLTVGSSPELARTSFRALLGSPVDTNPVCAALWTLAKLQRGAVPPANAKSNLIPISSFRTQRQVGQEFQNINVASSLCLEAHPQSVRGLQAAVFITSVVLNMALFEQSIEQSTLTLPSDDCSRLMQFVQSLVPQLGEQQLQLPPLLVLYHIAPDVQASLAGQSPSELAFSLASLERTVRQQVLAALSRLGVTIGLMDSQRHDTSSAQCVIDVSVRPIHLPSSAVPDPALSHRPQAFDALNSQIVVARSQDAQLYESIRWLVGRSVTLQSSPPLSFVSPARAIGSASQHCLNSLRSHVDHRRASIAYLKGELGVVACTDAYPTPQILSSVCQSAASQTLCPPPSTWIAHFNECIRVIADRVANSAQSSQISWPPTLLGSLASLPHVDWNASPLVHRRRIAIERTMLPPPTQSEFSSAAGLLSYIERVPHLTQNGNLWRSLHKQLELEFVARGSAFASNQATDLEDDELFLIDVFQRIVQTRAHELIESELDFESDVQSPDRLTVLRSALSEAKLSDSTHAHEQLPRVPETVLNAYRNLQQRKEKSRHSAAERRTAPLPASATPKRPRHLDDITNHEHNIASSPAASDEPAHKRPATSASTAQASQWAIQLAEERQRAAAFDRVLANMELELGL